MKIEVTQKDIDEGVQGECQLCPIALAFKRKTKLKHVDVSGKYIVLYRRKSNNLHELPKEAQTFIKRFDGEKTVKPFSFELENL